MRIKFILNFPLCTILTNLFNFVGGKFNLFWLRGATVPEGICTTFQNGCVAQLYSASDFGSEGWGLESLRGHKKR